MRISTLALTLVAAACSTARTPVEGPREATVGDAVAGSTFVRFRLSGEFRPCDSPGAEWFGCDDDYELRADGRFEHQRGDAIAGRTISASDLAAAVKVLTDPELLLLLDGGEKLCQSEVPEGMELDIDGRRRTDSNTGCRNEAPILAARAEMRRLAAAYRI